MSITIKHLRGFVAVAHHGNFTRAAEALSLSQPALTITVSQFEDLVGVKLFDRTTRRVRLTADGEDFLPGALRLIEEFDSVISGMRDVAERRRGRVGLAALPSVAIRLLPETVADYCSRYPSISVHLHDDNARGVGERVRRGEVDFGIASRWQPIGDLSFRPLLKDTFGLVCRADHALARGRGPLTWRDLAGHDFLGLAADTGIQQVLGGIKGLPDNVRGPRFEVSNVATLNGMLSAGLGITALPELAVPSETASRIVFRRLTRPSVQREICLITRRGRSLSPAAQGLRDLIVANFPRASSRPAARANNK